jgi:regulator of sirC expression with transglutaminase-like and TPR domain
MKPAAHIQDRLRRIGTIPSDQIRLADTALFLATAIDKNKRVAPYIRHLKKLCFDVAGYIGPAPMPGNDNHGPDLGTRAEALRQVLAKRYGYGVAPAAADPLEASSFMRLIDSRFGADSALAILYLHVARSLDWPAVAIDFPHHVLVRLETPGERAIYDPANGFKACAPQDLRRLIKKALGKQAELTPAHYAVMDSRALLLCLQMEVKTALLEQERFFDAIDVIDTALLFAPLEAVLWREAGHLHARLDNVPAAIDALETFQRLNNGDEHRYRTSVLLQELRGRLQ